MNLIAILSVESGFTPVFYETLPYWTTTGSMIRVKIGRFIFCHRVYRSPESYIENLLAGDKDWKYHSTIGENITNWIPYVRA